MKPHPAVLHVLQLLRNEWFEVRRSVAVLQRMLQNMRQVRICPC